AWCHGWVPVLLPAIALCVGPPSALSLDDLVRRWLGRPVSREQTLRCQGAVLLAQFAAAMVFASAALSKLGRAPETSFAWCYSDNLRNTLLLQYWVLDEP